MINKAFPRKKAGQEHFQHSIRVPVLLDENIIQKHFGLLLVQAATKLGISSTALKSACRHAPGPCHSPATPTTDHPRPRNTPLTEPPP